MTNLLPPLTLTCGSVLQNGALVATSLGIAGGKICSAAHPMVDLGGFLILPGIIDLHGDGFEHHMAPRPSARLPMALGLASFDREAAAHGVTTAYMAQGWSWEGGHRGPEQAEALMLALDAYRPQAMTDLRIQIRAETHMIGANARLIAAVRAHNLDYVIFNDHLPEALAMANKAPGDFAAWAHKIGRASAEMMQVVQEAATQSRQVPQSLRQLAEAFDALAVRYGSHDDPDAETRSYYAMIGAVIAEFPTTRNAAVAARAMDNPVLMGAPNVLRGRSQAGNISASDLIADGLCDVLVSDYHTPALPLAAWSLVDRGILDLPQAWAMISSRPAEVVGLKDRGHLTPGLRADLVVVNQQTRGIEATICGGRLTHLSGEAARRFMAAPLGAQSLAAE